jgi:hypothetical protein
MFVDTGRAPPFLWLTAIAYFRHDGRERSYNGARDESARFEQGRSRTSRAHLFAEGQRRGEGRRANEEYMRVEGN